MSHPHTLAHALNCIAAVHITRGEGHAAQTLAEEKIALARAQEFPFWVAGGTSVRGLALITQGQRAEGIAELQEGIAAFQAIGATLGRTADLGFLAEAYGNEGRVEDGRRTIAPVLEMLQHGEEQIYEAMLYRIKGELALQSGSAKEAEGYFHHSVKVAHHQGARSFELQAVMCLSRLWQRQGKRTKAHRLLLDIFNCFTEGFDTKDLQAAKALLNDLADNSPSLREGEIR